jgi:hypothetical protein
MSWDVMLLNIGDQPRATSTMEEGLEPTPLGEAQRVRDSISATEPEVDWRDPEWGVLATSEWSIEFNLGEREPVDSIMLHVRGGGDPVSNILRLCSKYGWSALDLSSGDFIDPERPSNSGWQGFQDFRDRALGHPRT